MKEFTFTIDNLNFHEQDPTRPESVCCVASGVVATSNDTGQLGSD